MINRHRAIAALGFTLALLACVRGGAQAGTPGIDGAKTITAANTVVNGYDIVTTATAGTRTITGTNVANLSPAGLTPLGAGSVLMLYQANGATIDGADDTVAWGSITAYNNAGYYEFVTVASVSGNTITISSTCNTLSHSYTASSEIVRVPQYSTLTIAAGGSIAATPWSTNEADGGIVAINVAGATTINGSINVTGAGFAGAAAYVNAGDSAPPGHAEVTDYFLSGETGANLSTALAAAKGESIAGNDATYDANYGSRYGRGAPANGGGGGNGHNAGGGGGSNGNNGNTWYGQGILDTGYTAFYSNSNGKNPTGAADPGYTNMTTDSGGGRGGYTFGYANDTAVKIYPVGGLGGRPLTAAVAGSRVFFGGGGGAGDANDVAGGNGGNGGGIVLINTGTITGSGSIVANGAAGGSTPAQDAGGGGGGGGSVVILSAAGTGSLATINANGGAGGVNGSDAADPNEAEGPGGGGGGGFVAATNDATTITIAGGADGTSQGSTTVTEGMLPYGATLGATGASVAAPTSFTYCYTPVLGVAKSVGTPVEVSSGVYNITYTVLFENYGDTPLNTVGAEDLLTNTFPSPLTFTITTAPAVTSTTNGATGTVTAGFNGNSQDYLIKTGTLPVSNPATAATTSTITITYTVQVTGVPTGAHTYNNEVTSGAFGTTGNANGVEVLDGSDNGTNPDPAGLGNPDTPAENVPTPVTLYGPAPFTKTVQNITTGEATGLTADTAIPGNILKYTLSFTNNTAGNLTGYSIKDVIPTNTTYYATTPAACSAYPAGMTCTAVYTPPVGATAGYVTFTLSGTATGQTSPGVPTTTTTSPAQLIFTFEVTVN